MARSRQKFVVVDLRVVETLGDIGVYPLSLPLVLRQGRYTVHRVDGPCGWLTPNPPPPGRYDKVHGLVGFRKGPRAGFAERDGEPILFESLHQTEPMHWWQPRFRIVPITKEELAIGVELADLWRKHGDSLGRADAAARFTELTGKLERSLTARAPKGTIVDAYFRRAEGPDLAADVPALEVRWTAVPP
jgi:hypothetical protein